MAKYKIRFKKFVAEDLRNIAISDVKRILGRVDELADDPKGPGVPSSLLRRGIG